VQAAQAAMILVRAGVQRMLQAAAQILTATRARLMHWCQAQAGAMAQAAAVHGAPLMLQTQITTVHLASPLMHAAALVHTMDMSAIMTLMGQLKDPALQHHAVQAQMALLLVRLSEWHRQLIAMKYAAAQQHTMDIPAIQTRQTALNGTAYVLGQPALLQLLHITAQPGGEHAHPMMVRAATQWEQAVQLFMSNQAIAQKVPVT
jgi:hypothetical protein